MAATYRVECTGVAREVYLVEADSPQEAMAKWSEGICVISEAESTEPVSAELED